MRGPVRVCLHQPNFLPWTKLVDKVLGCDTWIAYDSVQYTRSEFHSRQRIKGRAGPVWLSVPVLNRGCGRQRLCDVQLVPGARWRAAHLNLFNEHYRRAPHFSEVFALLEGVYTGGDTHLVDFSLRLTGALLTYLGAGVRIVRASSLPHDPAADNTTRLIELTRAAGGEVHVTSTYGTERTYIDWERVAAAGIRVESQVFSKPQYPQLHGPFEAGLSVVDLLFALGPQAVPFLETGRRFDRVDPAGERQIALEVQSARA